MSSTLMKTNAHFNKRMYTLLKVFTVIEAFTISVFLNGKAKIIQRYQQIYLTVFHGREKILNDLFLQHSILLFGVLHLKTKSTYCRFKHTYNYISRKTHPNSILSLSPFEEKVLFKAEKAFNM